MALGAEHSDWWSCKEMHKGLSHDSTEDFCNWLVNSVHGVVENLVGTCCRAGDQGGAVLYLGVRLEVSQFPIHATTPSCETVHLTVTPGCFVTNLTPWQLLCQPSKIVGPSAASQIQVSPFKQIWNCSSLGRTDSSIMPGICS